MAMRKGKGRPALKLSGPKPWPESQPIRRRKSGSSSRKRVLRALGETAMIRHGTRRRKVGWPALVATAKGGRKKCFVIRRAELAKKEDEWRQSMWSLQSEKGMLEGRVAELVEERNALSRQLEEARNEAWKHKEESSSAHSLVYQVRNQVDRLEEENSELRKEPSRTGNPLTADASTSTDFDGSAETMDELRRRAREAERRAKDAEDELQRAKAAMEGRLVQHQVERFESTADQTRRDPFDSGDAELLQPSFGAPRHSHANTREEETGKIDEEVRLVLCSFDNGTWRSPLTLGLILERMC